MAGMDHSSMPDVSTQAMPGMDHRAIPEKGQGDMAGMGAMPSMAMGPMQVGSAPADARSDAYCAGAAGSPKHRWHTHGRVPDGLRIAAGRSGGKGGVE